MIKRRYHNWKKWECYKAGFYNSSPPNEMNVEEAERIYKDIIGNLNKFKRGIKMVMKEWKFSCDHNLTNINLNRVAWLGQAAVCILTGIPSKFRYSFLELSKKKQENANILALRYINKFEEKKEEEYDFELF